MMELAFTKMNGAGNDFVVLDNRHGANSLDSQQIAMICDRHRGVGADGLLLVEPAQKGADFRMRYFNSDGGEAEMCGNGARCFARFARALLSAAPDRISFETAAGEVVARFAGDLVSLRMSDPVARSGPLDLVLAGSLRALHSLNTGVPHAVAFVGDVESVDVVAEGREARHHEAFTPKGTNVNFAQVIEPGSLRLRTYERGVEGETLACGTGVCAAALIHAGLAGLAGPVSVRVRGGDTLSVAFRRVGENFTDVVLTGPADFVFEGRISL